MTGASPYVGLAPFGEQDADRFFGRDAERKRIISNLHASRFTLLYARSGVGKTSLLRAGVVARLAAAPGSGLVPFIFSSWSGDPNFELARALGAGGDGLEEALERRTGAMDGTLLVILDQFEEFFEYHQGKPEGTRFADELAGCVQRNDLRAHFLVSIREDAYSRLGDEFKGRLPNVYSNYLHLDDLDERGARAAIEEPLRHVGNGSASIEPALVAQVLRDVRRDEASNGRSRYETAHLQYVLRRLWDEEARRGSPVLRAATLAELGGSKAIFERHFDEAVTGLDAAEQDALAGAFRFLVTSAGAKRAESVADLADLTGAPKPTLERALGHLREARVLTPVNVSGETRYELAHDLLAEAALEWRTRHTAAKRIDEQRRAARAATRRRLLRLVGVVAAVAFGAVALLAVLANAERNEAQQQEARARALALEASDQEALARVSEKEAFRQERRANELADRAKRQARKANRLAGINKRQAVQARALSEENRRRAAEAQALAADNRRRATQQRALAEENRRNADRAEGEAARANRLADTNRRNADRAEDEAARANRLADINRRRTRLAKQERAEAESIAETNQGWVNKLSSHMVDFVTGYQWAVTPPNRRSSRTGVLLLSISAPAGARITAACRPHVCERFQHIVGARPENVSIRTIEGRRFPQGSRIRLLVTVGDSARYRELLVGRREINATLTVGCRPAGASVPPGEPVFRCPEV